MKTVASKVNSPSVFSTHFTQHCSSCDGHVKSLKREFSDQAWSALVAWKELPQNAVEAPLCNDCYFNLRDVLIERADEMRLLSSNAVMATKKTRQNSVARA